MFCSNCGAQMAKGQRFCSNCGARAEIFTPKAAEPVPEPETAPEPVYEQPAYTPAYGQPGNAAVPPAEPWAPPTPPRSPNPVQIERPKKKKKGWIVALVVIVLLAAAAAAVVLLTPLSAYAENFIARTFSDPAEYYRRVEKNSLDTATGAIETGGEAAEMTRAMGDSLRYMEEKMQLRFDESALSDELLDLIEDETGVDISWFRNLGLYVSAGQEESASGGRITAFLNDTDIIFADFVMDLEGEAIYFDVPKLSDKAARLDLAGLSSLYAEGFASGQELAALFTDGETLPILIERYSEIVLRNLTNVEKSTQELSVGALSGKYTALTVTVDAETFYRIEKEVLNKVKNDAEIQKLLLVTFKNGGMSEDAANGMYDEFLSAIDEELADVETVDVAADKDVLLMTVYVDGKGKIVGRDFVALEEGEKEIGHLNCALLRKGLDYSLCAEFAFTEDDEDYGQDVFARLSGGGTLSLKGEIEGSFDLYLKDLSGWNGELEGFDGEALRIDLNASVQDSSFRGELNFTPSEALIDLAVEDAELPAPVEELLRSLSLSYSLEARLGRASLLTALKTDGRELLGASVEAYPVEEFPVRVPSDAVDVSEWAYSIDFTKAYDILSDLMEAGVPASLLGSVSDFL